MCVWVYSRGHLFSYPAWRIQPLCGSRRGSLAVFPRLKGRKIYLYSIWWWFKSWHSTDYDYSWAMRLTSFLFAVFVDSISVQLTHLQNDCRSGPTFCNSHLCPRVFKKFKKYLNFNVQLGNFLAKRDKAPPRLVGHLHIQITKKSAQKVTIEPRSIFFPYVVRGPPSSSS
jgi:hypothetical protein